MSLLAPSRRWRPTATDLAVGSIGVGLAGGGLILTEVMTDTATLSYLANGLLSVGVAVALVGVLLRVQLDLQDELDEARRARLQFEDEMRRDVELIDRRVTQALSRIPEDAAASRESRAELVDELTRKLERARQHVRELEADLTKRRRGPSLVASLLAARRDTAGIPADDKSNPSDSSDEERRTDRCRGTRVALRTFGATAGIVAFPIGLVVALHWAIYAWIPGAHYNLLPVDGFSLPAGWEWLMLIVASISLVAYKLSTHRRVAFFVGYILVGNVIVLGIQLLFGSASLR